MAGYTLEQKQAIVKQLSDAYREGEAEILRKLANGSLSEWSHGRYTQQLKEIRAVLAELDAVALRWAQLHIPGLYEDGARVVDSYLPVLGDFSFTRLHAEAVELLQANMTERLASATQRVGRQVADVYRRAGLEAIQQGLVQGETPREVSKRIVGQLQKRGIESFTDKRGRAWNLRTYADMVAQTTTMEAELQGTVNRTLEAGMDLVKVSDHQEECELCRPWEGRVLSLTGATAGYPTLEEAKAAGLFHPRCLHALTPYAPEVQG